MVNKMGIKRMASSVLGFVLRIIGYLIALIGVLLIIMDLTSKDSPNGIGSYIVVFVLAFLFIISGRYFGGNKQVKTSTVTTTKTFTTNSDSKVEKHVTHSGDMSSEDAINQAMDIMSMTMDAMKNGNTTVTIDNVEEVQPKPEPKEVVVVCEGCGARLKAMAGDKVECEYCGSTVAS